MLEREIPWPGNQINDITKFREDCYRRCHEENPTDSGWYEKTDKCGENCKKQLKIFEYLQGKNPCELRLQAPVFWYENYEHTAPPSSSSVKDSSTIEYIYIVLLIILIILMFMYIFGCIFIKNSNK